VDGLNAELTDQRVIFQETEQALASFAEHVARHLFFGTSAIPHEGDVDPAFEPVVP
jgi:hypothetical protein